MSPKRSIVAATLAGLVVGAAVTAILLSGRRLEVDNASSSPSPKTSDGTSSLLPESVVKPKRHVPHRPPTGTPSAGSGTATPVRDVEKLKKTPAKFQKAVAESVGQLSSKDAPSRAVAIQNLRRLGAKDEKLRVRPLIADSDARVRAAAVRTAAYFKDQEAFDGIAKLAASDKSSEVRAAAISSLIMTGGRKNERTAEILFKNMTSPEPQVRIAAVNALNLLDWELIGEKQLDIIKELAVKDGTYIEAGEEKIYPVREAAGTLLLAHGVKIVGE